MAATNYFKLNRVHILLFHISLTQMLHLGRSIFFGNIWGSLKGSWLFPVIPFPMAISYEPLKLRLSVHLCLLKNFKSPYSVLWLCHPLTMISLKDFWKLSPGSRGRFQLWMLFSDQLEFLNPLLPFLDCVPVNSCQQGKEFNTSGPWPT